MAFKGVRSSWLILARNSVLLRLASSASSLAATERQLGALAVGDVERRGHHQRELGRWSCSSALVVSSTRRSPSGPATVSSNEPGLIDAARRCAGRAPCGARLQIVAHLRRRQADDRRRGLADAAGIALVDEDEAARRGRWRSPSPGRRRSPASAARGFRAAHPCGAAPRRSSAPRARRRAPASWSCWRRSIRRLRERTRNSW